MSVGATKSASLKPTIALSVPVSGKVLLCHIDHVIGIGEVVDVSAMILRAVEAGALGILVAVAIVVPPEADLTDFDGGYSWSLLWCF